MRSRPDILTCVPFFFRRVRPKRWAGTSRAGGRYSRRPARCPRSHLRGIYDREGGFASEKGLLASEKGVFALEPCTLPQTTTALVGGCRVLYNIVDGLTRSVDTRGCLFCGWVARGGWSIWQHVWQASGPGLRHRWVMRREGRSLDRVLGAKREFYCYMYRRITHSRAQRRVAWFTSSREIFRKDVSKHGLQVTDFRGGVIIHRQRASAPADGSRQPLRECRSRPPREPHIRRER